ncbi:YadA-like family protein, partial [Phocoenobacter skyensis]
GGIKFDVAKSGFTTDTSTGDVSAETAGNTFATAADVATELNKKFGAGDIKDITSSNKTVTVSQASLEENNVDLKVNVGGTLSVDKATGAINVADDAITTDKLKDGNVTKDKLSQPVQDTLDKVGAGEVAKNDTNTVTGAKVHTAVEAAKESVEADGADAGLTVTEEQVAGKGTKFKVKLDDATKAQLKKEETVSTTDTNLTVDGSATNASGAKDFKLGLAKDLVIDSIGKSATGAKLTLGEDAITLSKGTKPVKLTGVADGELSASSKDAVNGSQLKAVKDIAEEKSVETVEASAAAQTSGLTVTETTNTATDKNWKVDLNKDTLATQLVVDGSASKSTLEEGLDLTYKANGTTKTTSLKTGLEFANGEGTVASIDADGKVKYGLSDAVQADIAAGKKHTDLTVNGGTSVTDTYNTTGNILAKKTTVDGQTIFDVKLADKVVLGTAGDQVVVDGTAGKVKAGQVTVDGKAGDVTGLTNVDLSGADFGTAGRAATEEQLKLVDTEAKKKSVETVSAGAGIAIAETDGANGKDYAVSVDFGEVAAGNAKAVTGDKVHTAVEAAKESVEADGADAGLTVTEEAVAGKGTKFKVKLDDATKAQLKKEETVSTTDTNLTVDGSATNASGAKDFKLGLAKDLVIDSIGKSATGAKLTLGEDAITLSKGTKPVKLTGIKAGESGTDAVNFDQLEAVRTVASQKTKLVAGVGTTLDGLGTDADPYKVNVDFGTVTAGNTKAVTGGAVYNALADKADKNLSNIDNAGKQVITGLVDAEGKDGISVNTAVDPNTGVKKFTIGLDAATNFAISKVETVSSTNANLLVDDKTQNASGGKEFKVTLNKDLTDLDSVVLGDKVADDVVSLSKDKGINAGKKQITNVASGLGGKNLKDIKNTDAEWNNAATVGDLTKVEGNVTHINKIIGGQNADGKPVDGNGDQLTDSDGNAITTAEALKTYDVRGQTATNDNTVISAIKNMNEGGIKYFHTNDKSGQTVGGDVSDTDDSSASGKYATAIGYNASAAAENTIAFGKGAKATAENSIAIGTGNIVNAKKSGAIGDPSIIEAKDSKGMAVEGVYSIGNDNAINSSDTFVLGNNVNSKKVAGKTVAQGDTVENSVYLGSKTTATKSETNAAGKKVRDVGNKNLKSDGTKGKTTSAGDKGTVKSATVGGITYGGFAGATAKGVVSVGAADSERRIQNVAAGEISRTSTDAINGSQLHATNRALANLSDKLMDIDTGSKAGIAGSAAIAMLGQARNAGDRAISAGFATHRGESALAVGVSSWSDNGKWLLKGSASYDSQRNTTFGGSATYNW